MSYKILIKEFIIGKNMKYQTLKVNRIKFISLILFVCTFTINVNAQKRRVSAFIFQPHWYLGANMGLNTFVGEGWGVYSPLQSLGFSGRVAGGYNFSPVIGFRAMAGYATHNWPDIRYSDMNLAFGAENVTADVMVNMSNLIAGYYLTRPLDISLYGGAGFSHRDKAVFINDLSTYIVRGGLQADLHLTQFWDLNLMAELNVAPDNYNEYSVGAPFDIYPAITVGLTYHFRDACGVCGR